MENEAEHVKEDLRKLARDEAQAKRTPPTKEEVHSWIKRDISAASYFLGMLLQNPDLIKTLSDQLYDRIMSEQQGALIDHIEKRKEAKNGG